MQTISKYALHPVDKHKHANSSNNTHISIQP